MSLDTIRNAVAALEASGTAVSIRRLHQALPGVGRSTIGRHLATLRAERGGTQASGEDVATAVREQGSAPDPDQGVQQAQEALDGAKAHLAAVQRDNQLALNQGLLLNTALRAGTLSRQSQAWQPFDFAQQQLAQATEAVADAVAALQTADRRHQGRLRAEAEAAYSASAAGKAILEEIDRLKRLYDDAAAKELGSAASYSHGLSIERGHFNAGVSRVLATMQPAVPPAPSGPPPRLSVAVLRQCYMPTEGIGRVLPSGVARFEYEDYPVLVQARESLREELYEANRTYRDLEGDEAMSAAAWHDPRTLPLRLAKQKTGILHTAVQLVDIDIRNLQQRAASEGRTL